MLEVKYFFRGYTYDVLEEAMQELNRQNIRCKCRGCKAEGRIHYLDTVDEEAACTFGPWFDNVLHERGLVVLRKDDWNEISSNGPFDNLGDKFRIPHFSDDDCHLVESPSGDFGKGGLARWELIYIGKRLWKVESINNQWIKQFERVFGEHHYEHLSSPPTPPPSPKMASLPSPPQPLPITTTINQGLELQELKKQLATQGLELQALKKQLATQAAETQTLKE